MKKTFLLLAFTALTAVAFAQNKTLPSVSVKTLEGQSINVQELGKTGHITVISFWATWCSPCKKEMDAVKDYYDEWQEKYGLEFVAVSIDDARSAAKIPAMVQEKGWPYRLPLAANQDFKNAANIVTVPHTFLLDAQGNIVFEHSGYTPGDELELEEQIKLLKK